MKFKLSKLVLLIVIFIVLFSSCASKKDIIMFGDIKEGVESSIVYSLPKIQVNDILDVKITTLNPETAILYNSGSTSTGAVPSIELMKLQGHLVTAEGKITLPILGEIVAAGKSISELEKKYNFCS